MKLRRMGHSASLMVRFMRSTCPLVQGWFGFVNRCSMPCKKTDPVKGMSAKAGGWPFAVLRQVGELDSVIGEHGMDAIGNRFDKGLEKGSGGLHVGLFYKLDRDELGGAIDGDQEVKLAFRGTYFGQIDMEETDRISVEFLPSGLAAFDFRQPADAMPFQTTMQRRAA